MSKENVEAPVITLQAANLRGGLCSSLSSQRAELGTLEISELESALQNGPSHALHCLVATLSCGMVGRDVLH